MNILALTVASHDLHYYKQFQSSCAKVRIKPLILGWGRPFEGYGYRLKLVYDYLQQEISSNDIILFVDAFDSVLLSSLDRIYSEFLRLNATLLVSAEKLCFPDFRKSRLYPPSPTPYRFLCAGGWIGYRQAILAAFQALDVARCPGDIDDQDLLGDYYLSGNSVITLDHNCSIFQCLYGALDDIVIENGCLRNRLTGTQPKILHGNGRADMSSIFEFIGL